MQAIVEWIISLFITLVGALIQILNTIVIHSLTNSNSFSGSIIEGKGMLSVFTQTFTGLDFLFDLFRTIAVVIAGFIFMFQLVRSIAEPNEREVEHPIRLLINFAFSFFMIYWSIYIIDFILQVGALPYQYFSASSLSDAVFGPSYQADVVVDTVQSLAEIDLPKIVTAVVGNALSAFASSVMVGVLGSTTGVIVVSIISLVLLFILLISYFKLITEVFERYVTLGVLVLFSPFMYSFYVSRSTRNITSSWLRMVINQVVLMSISVLFLRVFENTMLTALMIKTEGSINVFALLFMLIVWVKTASRFESHMQTMGFNVAQGGGGFGRELAQASMLAGRATNAGLNNGFDGYLRTGSRTKNPPQYDTTMGRLGAELKNQFGNGVSSTNSMVRDGKGINYTTADVMAEEQRDRTGTTALNTDLDHRHVEDMMNSGREGQYGGFPDKHGDKVGEALSDYFQLDEEMSQYGIEPINGMVDGKSNTGFLETMSANGEMARMNFEPYDPEKFDDSAFGMITGTDGKEYMYSLEGDGATGFITGSDAPIEGKNLNDVLALSGESAQYDNFESTPATNALDGGITEGATGKISSGYVTASEDYYDSSYPDIGHYEVAIGPDTFNDDNELNRHQYDEKSDSYFPNAEGKYVPNADGEFQFIGPKELETTDVGGISVSPTSTNGSDYRVFLDAEGKRHAVHTPGVATIGQDEDGYYATGLRKEGSSEADYETKARLDDAYLIRDDDGNVIGFENMETYEGEELASSRIFNGQSLKDAQRAANNKSTMTLGQGTFALPNGNTLHVGDTMPNAQANDDGTVTLDKGKAFFSKNTNGEFVPDKNGSYLPDSKGNMVNVGTKGKDLSSAVYQPEGSAVGAMIKTDAGYAPLYNAGVLETNAQGQVATRGNDGNKVWSEPSPSAINYSPDGEVASYKTESAMMQLQGKVEKSWKPSEHAVLSEGMGIKGYDQEVHPIAPQSISEDGSLQRYTAEGEPIEGNATYASGQFAYTQGENGSQLTRLPDGQDASYFTPSYSVGGISTDKNGFKPLTDFDSYSVQPNFISMRESALAGGKEVRMFSVPQNKIDSNQMASDYNAPVTSVLTLGNRPIENGNVTSNFIARPASNGSFITPEMRQSSTLDTPSGRYVMNTAQYGNQFKNSFDNHKAVANEGNLVHLSYDKNASCIISEYSSGSRFMYLSADHYKLPPKGNSSEPVKINGEMYHAFQTRTNDQQYYKNKDKASHDYIKQTSVNQFDAGITKSETKNVVPKTKVLPDFIEPKKNNSLRNVKIAAENLKDSLMR